MIGDTIEFAPGTDAEAPWLFDADGSQLDGEGRFTDGERHATYRFQLPADVTGGTLTLHIANEFVVEVSTDNATWREVLQGADAGARPRQPRPAARSTSTSSAPGAGRCTCASATPSPTTAGAAGWTTCGWRCSAGHSARCRAARRAAGRGSISSSSRITLIA